MNEGADPLAVLLPASDVLACIATRQERYSGLLRFGEATIVVHFVLRRRQKTLVAGGDRASAKRLYRAKRVEAISRGSNNAE